MKVCYRNDSNWKQWNMLLDKEIKEPGHLAQRQTGRAASGFVDSHALVKPQFRQPASNLAGSNSGVQQNNTKVADVGLQSNRRMETIADPVACREVDNLDEIELESMKSWSDDEESPMSFVEGSQKNGADALEVLDGGGGKPNATAGFAGCEAAGVSKSGTQNVEPIAFGKLFGGTSVVADAVATNESASMEKPK